jgi:hypothetical protein
LPRTFPQHADFTPGGGGGDGSAARVDTPTLASLRRVLLTFAAYEPSVGYCQSLNFVAAMLILVGGEEFGFWMLAAICADVIPDYHTHQMTGLRIDSQVAGALTHVHCMCTACALHVHCVCTGVCTACALRVHWRVHCVCTACACACALHMHCRLATAACAPCRLWPRSSARPFPSSRRTSTR